MRSEAQAFRSHGDCVKARATLHVIGQVTCSCALLPSSLVVVQYKARPARCSDLTGEPLFMREMIDQYHSRAEANGVRIVHCCGFDCVPSEAGTLLVADELRRVHGKAVGECALVVMDCALPPLLRLINVHANVHMLPVAFNARDAFSRAWCLHRTSLMGTRLTWSPCCSQRRCERRHH
jgi:hypothetical protein